MRWFERLSLRSCCADSCRDQHLYRSYLLTKFPAYFILILCLCAGCHSDRQDFPTLEYSDIVKLGVGTPFVQEYGSSKKLLVYGSNHTSDPSDPQIREIGKQVAQFKPDLILYEGHGIATETDRARTIASYFEMGFVKFLADSLRIPALNIEPPAKEKYDALLEKFTEEEVMLATLGLQITMLQAMNQDFEKAYPVMVKSLAEEGFPLPEEKRSLAYFYKIYRMYFGKAFSYGSFDSRTIQSKYSETSLNRVNQEANKFRDHHILRLIEAQFETKKRIYLQIGGWHAIVCQPAFELITRIS